MIPKELLLNMFDTTSIQRWNDKLRPVNLVELDYQAHRMMIAYVLGKFEEEDHKVDWARIIDNVVFDLLETAVLTDLKWNVKDRLNSSGDRRLKKDEYVQGQLNPLLGPISADLQAKLGTYQRSQRASSIPRKILKTASSFARWWEFQTFLPANPSGYEMGQIKSSLEDDNARYSDMRGCREVLSNKRNRDFIEVCAQLRFQGRWSYMHIVPRVSVLGHSMFVATVSYLFSVEAGSDESTMIRNFFTGLFHDLEETQTRDVRGPLKKELPGLREVLLDISKELMESTVLPLLPKQWTDEFKAYSMTDLKSGSLVKAADDLSAIVEAYVAQQNGCKNPELIEVKPAILKKYRDLGDVKIGNVSATDIFEKF